MAAPTEALIEAVEADAYTIPTDAPESDGTLAWDRTTLVLATVRGGGETGIGYTYADRAAAVLIREQLGPLILERSAMAPAASWHAMVHGTRNLGRPGVAAMAVSAVDVALWDLKARLLGLSVANLLGVVRPAVTAYGSGGFTSYGDARLAGQLTAWADHGLTAVKMKVGRHPEDDARRVALARDAIGEGVALFVDANGAYTRKQALALAERFAEQRVTWLEEPVSSDDLASLRLLVEQAPAGMEIAAGEYGYGNFYFRQMLEAGAVDVLQPDATRCGGITGFLAAAALAEAWGLPISAPTAPSLHRVLGCVCNGVRHIEYFHDHVRVEERLFDGAAEAVGGSIAPDLSRPGLGLSLKTADADPYKGVA